MPEGGWELEESRTTWSRLARSKRPVCLQESRPLRAASIGRRKTAGPRVPDCRRQVRVPGEPSSFFFATVQGGLRARAGRSAWGVCGWVLGLARSAHRGVGRATAARRQMRVRPRADACTRQRRAHPQTVQSCGGPAEL